VSCQCQKCKTREANKVVTMPNGAKRIRCDGCGRGIPPYSDMQGSGFQSASVDHEYMDHDELGHNFFVPVHTELCYPCYLADYAKTYPDGNQPEIVNVRDFEDVPSYSLDNHQNSQQGVAVYPTGCFVFTA